MRRNIGERFVWRKFQRKGHEILIGRMGRDNGTTSWQALYETPTGDSIQGHGDTLKAALNKLRLRALLAQNPDAKRAHKRFKNSVKNSPNF